MKIYYTEPLRYFLFCEEAYETAGLLDFKERDKVEAHMKTIQPDWTAEEINGYFYYGRDEIARLFDYPDFKAMKAHREGGFFIRPWIH